MYLKAFIEIREKSGWCNLILCSVKLALGSFKVDFSSNYFNNCTTQRFASSNCDSCYLVLNETYELIWIVGLGYY
jgi:hypothetical protein